jgi:uncharacterized protein YabN with tetrapyrrole methylase and pyrophosphatase domain
VLSGLPPALPALVMACRLQERAAGVGFDWPDARGPIAKVREELAEVESELAAGPGASGADPVAEPTGEPVYPAAPEALMDEVGDLLFAVVNLARKTRVPPATALDRANAKFRGRFEAMERMAVERGIDVTTAGLERLDALWNEAKAEGGGRAPLRPQG